MAENDDLLRAMYAAHPISATHILAKIGPGPHAPEVLWDHDQDHYGGLAANAALADAVGMRPGMRVADFCAGSAARRGGMRTIGGPMSRALI